MDTFPEADSSFFRKSFVASTIRRYSARQAQAITGFVPQQLRQSLSKHIQPTSETSCGCCVLVDISGFCKLSNIAFANGSAGLDHFRRLVNDVFNSLIGVIEECGGDVISFAGDALICYFAPTTTTSIMVPAECVLRAVYCTVRMSELEIEHVTVHCAVAAGDVCFGMLGGYEEMWVYLMSFICFEQLGHCIDEAGPREVVISRDTYGFYCLQLDQYFACVRLASTNVKVVGIQDTIKIANCTPLALSCDTLSLVKFIPKPVHAAAISDTLDTLAEVRFITTLFLRLDSYDSQRMRDVITLQSFYVAMQEVIFEYGGFVRQFVIDDKGCVLIVLWGVPSASFPNNCCRAVSCAAAMMLRTKEINHACSIGITTGTAYCGTVGSKNRHEYVAMGKMVNISARLMTAAKGRILLCSATRDLLPLEMLQRIDACDVGRLKGFQEKSNVYQYHVAKLGRYPTPALDAPRDEYIHIPKAVLASLERALSIAMQLSSDPTLGTHYVFLKGEPGSGKTSMLQKLCRDGVKAGVQMICIRLSSKHIEETYALIRKIILECLQRENMHIDDVLNMTHMREVFPHETGEQLTIQYIPMLCHILQPSANTMTPRKSVSPRVHPMEPFESSIVPYVVAWLRKLSITAIIVDGAENMSEASWRLLSVFSRYHAPVLIAASISVAGVPARNLEATDNSRSSGSWNTSRVSTVVASYKSRIFYKNSTETSRDIHRLTGHGDIFIESSQTSTITLHKLSFEDICKLFQDDAVSATPIALSVMEHIYDISGGNAFWVFLLRRFICDCGVDEFEKLVELKIANHIFVTCLLSNYTTAQMHIIKVSSVIGEEFDAATLRKLVPRMRHSELTRGLNQFVHDGLVHRLGGGNFRFHSEMIRNVIYEFIPRSDAERLHYKVANAILAENSEDVDRVAASGVGHRHLTLRFAQTASQQLMHQGNIAHAVCYIALALQMASSRAEYTKILNEILAIEAVLQSEEDRLHRSTYEHLMALKDRAIQGTQEVVVLNAEAKNTILSIILSFLSCIRM